MLKITLISVLLLSKLAFSQVKEQFSDGDFIQNPSWYGDLSYFQVNNQKQLQSKGLAIASQTYTISTVNELCLNARWEFFVQLNFDPTATNFARIYLSADRRELAGALNGYFIQIGETGASDGVHLYRQSGTSLTRIITGGQKIRPNVNLMTVRVRVSRDEAGKWMLYTDATGGGQFVPEGSAIDQTIVQSGFMGVFCKYATASRFNQYIFDDFSVEELVPDTVPPRLKSLVMVDSTHAVLTFSEPLDAASALNSSHYFLSDGYGNPESVISTASSTAYRLNFYRPLSTARYELMLNHIQDKKGNEIATDTRIGFFYIKPYAAKSGDVVINEIFANPGGSPGLPVREFLELWNVTDQYILLQGWKYSDQTSSFTFPVDTLKPNSHVIVCARADTNVFKPYGKTIGISPWPSLNNDQDLLSLVNQKGGLISQVVYYDTYYKADLKKKGGYSLELIDPENRCTGIQNWSASEDASGGTPGRQNSIYRAQISTEIPKLVSVEILDSLRFQIVFSKSVDSLSAVQISNYSINMALGHPIEVSIASADFNSIVLKYEKPIIRGTEYELTLGPVSDCAGNVLDIQTHSAKLFTAKKIRAGDLLVSEILFNPKPGGVDFVELYNTTDHVLDLKELQVANADAKGLPASLKNVSASTRLMPPGEYWVLTTSEVNVKLNYAVEYPDHFVSLNSLPVYNNDNGSVILLSNHQLIDRFDYSEKMHHSLLKNADGVSLERVSFQKGTNESSNFKSAAASVGFATPSYKNSQEPNGEESYVKLVSKTFSPNQDGFEDLAVLDYQFPENGILATVQVFNDRGLLVRRLFRNQTIGTKGYFSWDGLNEHGSLAAIGMYVILFDVFDLSGKTKRYTNTCVLAEKLN